MHKLFASDLDGTLSSGTRILEPQVRKKLEKLYNDGWTLLFTTGRCVKYAEDLLSSLSCPYFLACQNGSCLLDPEKNIITEHGIPKNLIPGLIEQQKKYGINWLLESGVSWGDKMFLENLDITLNQDTQLFSHMINIYFPTEQEKEIYVKTCTHSLLDYPHDFFAVAKTVGPFDKIQKLAEDLVLLFDDVYNVTCIRYPRQEGFGIIHVTHKKASKDQILSTLIDTVFREEKTFTIVAGDDCNDYAMIRNGHFKIVMETAPEFMKQIADFVAPSAEKLGIIKGLEEGEKMYLKLLSRNW